MTYTPEMKMLVSRLQADVARLKTALEALNVTTSVNEICVVTTSVDLSDTVSDAMEALSYPYRVGELAAYIQARHPGINRNHIAAIMAQRGYYRHRLSAGMFWVMAG